MKSTSNNSKPLLDDRVVRAVFVALLATGDYDLVKAIRGAPELDRPGPVDDDGLARFFAIVTAAIPKLTMRETRCLYSNTNLVDAARLAGVANAQAFLAAVARDVRAPESVRKRATNGAVVVRRRS